MAPVAGVGAAAATAGSQFSSSAEGDAGVPDWDNVEAWGATLGAVVIWIVVYIVLARCFQVGQQLTFDVLEQQQDVTTVKDTVRNIWTHIALIGALILTMAAPMMVDNEVPKYTKSHPTLTQLYLVMIVLAAIQVAEVTLECSLHLIYTEALTASGTMRYFIQSHSCVGGPMLVFSLGCINLLIAMAIWIFMCHGTAACISGCIAASALGFLVLTVLISASRFSPDPDDPGASGWVWVVSENENENKPPHRPWLDCFLHPNYSADQLKTLRMRAEAAALLEEKQGGSDVPAEGVSTSTARSSSIPGRLLSSTYESKDFGS